jgi:hypothetical protein
MQRAEIRPEAPRLRNRFREYAGTSACVAKGELARPQEVPCDIFRRFVFPPSCPTRSHSSTKRHTLSLSRNSSRASDATRAQMADQQLLALSNHQVHPCQHAQAAADQQRSGNKDRWRNCPLLLARCVLAKGRGRCRSPYQLGARLRRNAQCPPRHTPNRPHVRRGISV